MTQEENKLVVDCKQDELQERINKRLEDFITVGELREMLKDLDDDDLITVTKGNGFPNHKILYIDDAGTFFGFWELRIDY